ncbi:MAG: hypothetical protein LBS70_05015 [Candidatus Accumulibacter sp.]|nr:hypothetical protein [Accumulibacter sp.]
MSATFSTLFVTRDARGGGFRRALGGALLAAALCGGAWAGGGGEDDESAVSRFSFGGFGTLGVARAISGSERPLRDISQPKGISNSWSARNDSVFGLQASYRFNDSLEAVIQGASYLRNDGTYSPKLTWAFVKYDVTPRFSLRFGRVETEFLMHASSQRVGYSNLPVRPRIDLYGLVPFSSSDGIDAQLRWPIGDGLLHLGFLAGRASDDIPPYDLDGSKLLRGSIGYDWGNWEFRYIYAQGKLSENVPDVDPLRNTLSMLGAVRAARKLGVEDTVSRYSSFGLAYDDGRWQLQAAFNRITHETRLFENLDSASVAVARRFGDVTPFVTYTRAKSSHKKLASGLPGPMGAAIDAGIAQAMASSHADRRTWSLGARWDFARNMDIKAQIDFIRGHRNSMLLLEDNRVRGDGRAKVFSLSFDFMF